jgi:hypothetical protein
MWAPMVVAETGTIVKRISGCDYYLVDAPSRYAVLEWMGGHDPDTDDTVTGNFKRYGTHTFFVNGDTDTETRAWIEDWGLTKSEALEKLVDQCD